MKIKHLITAISILFFGLLVNNAFSQQVIFPPGFEQQVRIKYNALTHKEVSFVQYLEAQKRNYRYKQNLENGTSALYNGCDEANTVCGNGDFETGTINQAEWDGAFGTLDANGEANPAIMTEGFSTDPNITSANSHQTIVNAGTDPTVSTLSTVAPGGSTRSLRIGNTAVGAGTELISKRITVTAGQTIINFMYAVVLQSPANHSPVERPAFWVRVVDCATGQEIPNVVNLGNGVNKIIGDVSDPFLQSAAGGTVAFRDWSCAQINLSSIPVGTVVNIQFITEDCSLTGHFGYAYIDNLCGTCTLIGGGALSLNTRDNCGPGRICLDYTLQQVNNVTGTLQLTLQIYQNGVLLQTTNSPVLSSGTQYCFNVNPSAIPGINDMLGGFDYVVTGNFNMNGFITQIILGNPPTGQTAGQNNDYQIYCIDQCCPGRNLVRNPGFELGNLYFSTAYTYQPLIAPNSVSTGRYNVMTSAQGLIVSPTWDVNCTANGRHLYVNGATGATGTKIVWFQNVSVERGKTYKFCVDMKNLPQCAFDVKPKVNVLFTVPGFNITNHVINVPAGSCNWQSVDQEITMPAGSGSFLMNITITLDETGIGDGNDLALDNITLVEIPQVPQSEVILNVNIINLTATTFGVSASPVAWPVPDGCGYYWSVEELDVNNDPIPGTGVYNPSQWWVLYPNTFPGYNGTSVLSGALDGVFQLDRKYRIVYGRWCECEYWNSTSWTYDPKNREGKFVQDKQHALSPERIQAIMNGNYQPAGNEAQLVSSNLAPATESTRAQAGLRIYPNPVANNLVVMLPSKNSKGELLVYNMQEEVLLKLSVENDQKRIAVNTAQLPAGTYILHYIPAGGGVSAREKFVKL